jgi:hypothetical protein
MGKTSASGAHPLLVPFFILVRGIMSTQNKYGGRYDVSVIAERENPIYFDFYPE